MLRSTFLHLPGIGVRRERSLWERGILDWDGFLTAAENGCLREGAYRSAAPLVRRSLDAADCGDARFFHGLLPSGETWRMYPEFADRALFLDIETTGLSSHYDEVTLIGAFGCDGLALFVNGINLDEFPAYVARFPLLVTFNDYTRTYRLPSCLRRDRPTRKRRKATVEGSARLLSESPLAGLATGATTSARREKSVRCVGPPRAPGPKRRSPVRLPRGDRGL